MIRGISVSCFFLRERQRRRATVSLNEPVPVVPFSRFVVDLSFWEQKSLVWPLVWRTVRSQESTPQPR